MKLSLFVFVFSFIQPSFAETGCEYRMDSATQSDLDVTDRQQKIIEKFNKNYNNMENVPRVRVCKNIDNTLSELESVDHTAQLSISKFRAYIERKCEERDYAWTRINTLEELKKMNAIEIANVKEHHKMYCNKAELTAATANEKAKAAAKEKAAREAAVKTKEKPLPNICKALDEQIKVIHSGLAMNIEYSKIFEKIYASKISKTQDEYPANAEQYKLPKEELCEMITSAKKLMDNSNESNLLGSYGIDFLFRVKPGRTEMEDIKACDVKAKDNAIFISNKTAKANKSWEPIIASLNEGFCSNRKPASIKVNADQVSCLKDTDAGPDKKVEADAKIMLDVASQVQPKP